MKISILLGAVALVPFAGLCAEPPAETVSQTASPAAHESTPPADTASSDTKAVDGSEKVATQAAKADDAAAPPPSPTDDADFVRLAKTYTKVEQKGQTMFCRKEYPLGSRLPETHCLTEAELMDQVHTTRALKDQMQTKPKGIPQPAN